MIVQKVYVVLIATGGDGIYHARSGWDAAWPTRVQAEECARGAGAQDGWSAKVEELTIAQAIDLGWMGEEVQA